MLLYGVVQGKSIMRKLATIRQIDEIKAIPDADKICAYRVDGWWVVDAIDKFKVNDPVVYIEPDAWIPHEIAPFLSRGKDPSEYEGVRGERLRSIRLRGQLSQGLLIKYSELPKAFDAFHKTRLYDPDERWFDVTDILGVKKWEAPIPAQLSGQVRGAFPSSIPKTDQERVQNLKEELKEWKAAGYTWEITEKLDGTSMTVFLERDGRFGVCGRNWELSETAENSLWRAARADNIEHKLRETGRALAIQGELVGEGIQGNAYKLRGQQFWVYDIYDIADTRYLTAAERHQLVDAWVLRHVPVVSYYEISNTVADLLAMAEGKSALNGFAEQEGHVYKCRENPRISFKAISNKFLMKNGG